MKLQLKIYFTGEIMAKPNI